MMRIVGAVCVVFAFAGMMGCDAGPSDDLNPAQMVAAIDAGRSSASIAESGQYQDHLSTMEQVCGISQSQAADMATASWRFLKDEGTDGVSILQLLDFAAMGLRGEGWAAQLFEVSPEGWGETDDSCSMALALAATYYAR